MRDLSKFPNGVSDEGQTRRSGRVNVNGKATVATGLDTVEGVTVSLEALSVTAKHGWVVSAKASATVGAIDIVVLDKEGNEATTAVEVNWSAYGAG